LAKAKSLSFAFFYFSELGLFKVLQPISRTFFSSFPLAKPQIPDNVRALEALDFGGRTQTRRVASCPPEGRI
jgi:hypothetical protein